jgi:hypothetical protein
MLQSLELHSLLHHWPGSCSLDPRRGAFPTRVQVGEFSHRSQVGELFPRSQVGELSQPELTQGSFPFFLEFRQGSFSYRSTGWRAFPTGVQGGEFLPSEYRVGSFSRRSSGRETFPTEYRVGSFSLRR